MLDFERFLKTLGITLLYCFLWQGLELMFDGVITNRPVDNIIMLLFIPMIYRGIKK